MKNTSEVSIQSMIVAILLGTPVFADSADGVVRVKSNNNVTMTIDKLESALKTNGMTIFTRINHAAGAAWRSVRRRHVH